MASIDGIHQVVLDFHRHFCLGRSGFLGKELNAALNAAVFLGEGFLPFVHYIAERLHVLFRQCEHHFRLERDGIAHVSSMPRGQTSLTLGNGLSDEAHHEFVGIATSLVYFQPGVSATQSLEGYLHGRIVSISLRLLIIEFGSHVNAAGTSDDKLAPSFRVKIEQDVAMEFVFGQVVGTEHACFLIGSDERLNGSMLQVGSLHHSHDDGHTQSVVGTKRSTLGLHPLAVNPRFNRVSLKVVLAVGSFLRHHVHVRLEKHRLAVFHARRCGLAHHDISCRVLEGFHAHLGGEVKQKLLYLVQMARRSWHLCQCIEVLPDARRVQILDFVHSHYCFKVVECFLCKKLRAPHPHMPSNTTSMVCTVWTISTKKRASLSATP